MSSSFGLITFLGVMKKATWLMNKVRYRYFDINQHWSKLKLAAFVNAMDFNIILGFANLETVM